MLTWASTRTVASLLLIRQRSHVTFSFLLAHLDGLLLLSHFGRKRRCFVKSEPSILNYCLHIFIHTETYLLLGKDCLLGWEITHWEITQLVTLLNVSDQTELNATFLCVDCHSVNEIKRFTPLYSTGEEQPYIKKERRKCW